MCVHTQEARASWGDYVLYIVGFKVELLGLEM
jgi:hypothetical protein